jgi:hypothetical protein
MAQPMIFLSYAPEARSIAREIYQALRECEFNVWFDEVELRVGEASELALEGAIAKADTLLVLVGGEVVSRSSQQQEIRLALDRALRDQHFRILLILMSKGDLVESLPLALQKYPCLDLRDVPQRSRQLARLAAVLARDLDSGSQADDEEVGDRLRDSGDTAGAIPYYQTAMAARAFLD